MNLPPQLLQEIDSLRKEGYTIEVQEDGGSIGIIFKDYPLPKGVWNKEKTDLLIIAQITYPNAQLDMFWVTPGLLLANGQTPKSGDVQEIHCVTSWQRFSWHPQKWNPAHDNITTYLELVTYRLGMKE